jgi:N-methylhydantoinase A
MAKAKLAVDVGGTFTDIILICEEKNIFTVHKVPSTIEDQSIGVVKGIEEICENANVPLSDVDYILHGTTVATNITIERNGATVGMLTTKNYRDILHIARHKKVENFSIQQDLPWQSEPLVKRRHRLPITEKLSAPSGEITTPLKEEDVRAAVQQLKHSGVDVVIVCFMFSFLNDVHERRAKEIVNELWPEVLCFTSSEVVPQIREYERFSTTAMNAYVAPKVSRYVDHLVNSLERIGSKGKLHIMQSSGGMASVEMATATPVTLLKSGPAGGILAAVRWGELDNIENLISVDIGGTSADISVIPNRTAKLVNSLDATVNSSPVLTPMVDVETIGAGGGSIAYVDSGGAFRVGPKSAGANPGPACYNQGGQDPCVTDANIVLGRLDKEQFLGGDLNIDPELSFKAMEGLAKQLNMTTEEAALGVLKIINNHMALSVRASSVKKGTDPREFSLFAAGGAGPLHAVDLADAIDSKSVVVPTYPGVAAAIGLLVGNLKYDFIKSRVASSENTTEEVISTINNDFEGLIDKAKTQLKKDGIDSKFIVIERIAECRYVGQGIELRVPLPEGELTEDSMNEIYNNFHKVHEQEYGHHFSDTHVQIITLRVIGTGQIPSMEIPKLESGNRDNPKEAIAYVRDTVFEIDGVIKRIPTPRFKRDKLLAHDMINGPAIVVQRDSTTLIPPNWEATVSIYGTLLVSAKNITIETEQELVKIGL